MLLHTNHFLSPYAEADSTAENCFSPFPVVRQQASLIPASWDQPRGFPGSCNVRSQQACQPPSMTSEDFGHPTAQMLALKGSNTQLCSDQGVIGNWREQADMCCGHSALWLSSFHALDERLTRLRCLQAEQILCRPHRDCQQQHLLKPTP